MRRGSISTRTDPSRSIASRSNFRLGAGLGLLHDSVKLRSDSALTGSAAVAIAATVPPAVSRRMTSISAAVREKSLCEEVRHLARPDQLAGDGENLRAAAQAQRRFEMHHQDSVETQRAQPHDLFPGSRVGGDLGDAFGELPKPGRVEGHVQQGAARLRSQRRCGRRHWRPSLDRRPTAPSPRCESPKADRWRAPARRRAAAPGFAARSRPDARMRGRQSRAGPTIGPGWRSARPRPL